MRPLLLVTSLLAFGAEGKRADEVAAAAAPMVAAIELRLPQAAPPALVREAPNLVELRKGQRLSKRSIRKSIDRLFATGQVSDVVVRVTEGDEGATIVFELALKSRVAGVYVEGNRALGPSDVLSLAGLQRDAEYYAELVRDGVSALEDGYRRRGYEEVSVSATIDDLGSQGVEVTLVIDEGEPTLIKAINVVGSPGGELPSLVGVLGLSVGGHFDWNALDQGLERLTDHYRGQAFYRAAVGRPEVFRPEPRAVSLVLPVFSGPRYEIAVRGARSFSDELLKRVLAYKGAEALDQLVVERMARRLELFYRFRGFHDARVFPAEAVSPTGRQARLTFEVVEGDLYFVDRIDFVGRERLQEEELVDVLVATMRENEPGPAGELGTDFDPVGLEGRTRVLPAAAGAQADPTSTFVEGPYLEAATSMERLYRGQGFLSARVSLAGAEIDASSRTIRVKFNVTEGPRAMVRTVVIDGLPPAVSLKSVPGVEVGAFFDQRAVEEGRARVLQHLGRQGYLFGRVGLELAPNEKGTAVDVRYRVEPGVQVRVGKVVVQGLARTSEPIVASRLRVREADVLDPELLYETQRDLALLGVFRTVSVQVLAPDVVEPTKDVVVRVKELPRFSGEIGGGYFLAEGPRVVADLAHPNAGGRAINVSGRGKLHYMGGSAQYISGKMDRQLTELELLGWRGSVSATARSLLPGDIGTRVDLLTERVHLPTFRFTRFAAIPGLDWTDRYRLPGIDFADLKVAVVAQYEIEHDRVTALEESAGLLTSLTRGNEERLRFPFGVFSLHSLRLSPTFDLRDDPTNPHRGVLLALLAERTWDIYTEDERGLARPVQTLKLAGTLTGYIPLGGDWVLALQTRGGRILPMDPRSATIAPKRFFLGGASSMRGFREDGLIAADRRRALSREVRSCRELVISAANSMGCTLAAKGLLAGRDVPSEGGELFTLAKAELRLPSVGVFEPAVFGEAGNLWLAQAEFNPFELRYVFGAGLRFATPIGPVAFDVGINPAPDLLVNEAAVNVHFNIGVF